jgi:hypothetical protein
VREKLITAAEVAGIGCVTVGAFALSAALGLMVVGALLFAAARVADR